MKSILSISFCLLLLNIGYSQEFTDLTQDEAELATLLNELRSAKDDATKTAKNKAFKKKFKTVLENESAMTHPFSSLTTVGVIDSPDGLMRIVNWNVEKDDFSHEYNCFVLHIDKRKKAYHVTELIDVSFGMPQQPTEIIGSDQWYGALYYKIIPIKKGSKTLYTVLGWDYFSSMSQMKLIDVIYFTGKTVKLGSPVFKHGKETKKRIFFEHSKKASMSLKHEQHRNRIIFDHLSPESPSMKNFRSFYVPDLSYDAYVLSNNKWVLHEDVIGVNKGDSEKKQVVYVKNEKTGKIERKEIKKKWINPEDADAPIGGNEHVAVTPEMEVKNKKDNLSKEPEVDKKDKRDPSNLSFYKDIEKNKRKKKKKRNK